MCRLVLGDSRPKPSAKFCPVCDAWICDDCRRRWDLRTIAALKRAFGKQDKPAPRQEVSRA